MCKNKCNRCKAIEASASANEPCGSDQQELLKVLTEGDETLYNKAKSIVDEYYLEEGK